MMDWLPSVVFNWVVALLMAAYLLRAVRRFERTADRVTAKMERQHREYMEHLAAETAEQMRRYDLARDGIRSALRARVDTAIAALSSEPPPAEGAQVSGVGVAVAPH